VQVTPGTIHFVLRPASPPYGCPRVPGTEVL